MIGTTVGHFRLVGYLGRGGSGTVYRAVDEILDREVALKILNPGQIDPEVVARFRSEATTLAKLNHSAIATIYELLESDGHLMMAMECARGETLEQLCERDCPLTPDRAIALTERILAALDHAHRAGVLHRDVKPANIIVSADDLKITDFGIARMLGDQHRADEGMFGTPAYMAPEQILGEPLDERTDLYAVGVILYRLLTARLPFEGEKPASILQRQVGEAPAPLHTRRDGLPAWCEPLVQRALAKSKAERFQSAAEFREALTRVHAAAASDSPFRRANATRLRQTHRTLGAWSAATAVGLLVYASAARQFPKTPSPSVAITASNDPTTSSTISAAIAASPAAPSPEPVKPVPEPRAEKSETPFRKLEFNTKALIADGDKAHERDVRLVLADRTLTVTDNDASRLLHALPYDSITSINYSHSRDPLWASPNGPAPLIRTTGGVLRTFGFSVNRDWVSLITKTSIRFVVIRIADDDVTRLLEALQERTHRPVRRLEPKRETGRRSIL